MATEVVVEEVANNLEEAAQAVRHLNPKTLGFLAGGVCIGVGIGFILGQRWRKEKIRAEAFRESEAEVEQIREHYAQRVQGKPDLDKVVAEKGYIPAEEERPLPPPVPIIEDMHSSSARAHRTEAAMKDKYEDWVYPYELSKRDWRGAHIIHQDEFFSTEDDREYQQTTYTYYASDDKLVDTDDTVLLHRENLIGHDTLRQFGHGTDDYNIVYVRNPKLQLDIEIIRHAGYYAEEVLGLDVEAVEKEDEDERDEETTDG